ncbi:MAG: hypothetical protein K2H29_08095 [Oscillospiraceae bacterium]|nr:hypothetical protein [Oscillospiraceae bacterium]
MTLLITVFSALISTLIWYTNKKARKLKAGGLCLTFWGASLMWLVDAVAEYLEIGAAYFQPNVQDMLNDTFLGLSVIAAALVVWIIIIVIKNPEEIFKLK